MVSPVSNKQILEIQQVHVQIPSNMDDHQKVLVATGTVTMGPATRKLLSWMSVVFEGYGTLKSQLSNVSVPWVLVPQSQPLFFQPGMFPQFVSF